MIENLKEFLKGAVYTLIFITVLVLLIKNSSEALW